MFLLVLSAAGCAKTSTDSAGTGDDLAAPTNLKAEPLSGGAHLTWVDNSKEAEFMIERMSQGAAWKALTTVPFDTTQYHDATLEPNTTYMYRVMAMSQDGKHGPASNEAECAPSQASTGAAGSGHTGH